ncbi:ribonuclease P protein component [Filimonas effusa]|uniref:Ribonuclease P protein component n=2 Tax=Filimonas effusa TaxID=2508721 RepID=A0A4Q1CZL6_9BACT|nr:ribonuclease P protein component [Filimonas effusa]
MDAVFKEGRSFLVFPVKVFFFQPGPEIQMAAPLQTGVGAGSRHFKRAVHRNRIKRLLREAYRLQKPVLEQYLVDQGRQLSVFMLYIDKTLPTQEQLHQKMPLIMKRLIKELNTGPKDESPNAQSDKGEDGKQLQS